MSVGSLFLSLFLGLAFVVVFVVVALSWSSSWARRKYLKQLHKKNISEINKAMKVLKEIVPEELRFSSSILEEFRENYAPESWRDLEDKFKKLSAGLGTLYDKLGVIAYRQNHSTWQESEEIDSLLADFEEDLVKFESLSDLLEIRKEKIFKAKEEMGPLLEKARGGIARLSRKDSVLWHKDSSTDLIERLSHIEEEFCILKASPGENEKVDWLEKNKEASSLIATLQSIEKEALTSIDRAEVARSQGPLLLKILPNRCKELSEAFLSAGSPEKVRNYLRVAKKKMEKAQEMVARGDQVHWVIIFPILEEVEQNLAAVQEEIDMIKQGEEFIQKTKQVLNVEFDASKSTSLPSSDSSLG